jgi:sulfate permease, SulP family
MASTDPGAELLKPEQARRRVLPALDWLRRYDVADVRPDIVAGITLAAYLLPAGLGDASLANLPVEAGLYACLFSGLVFWLFCSSRHTAITVTSAISLLVGASLGELAGGDPARFWALASATALLTAALAFIAYLVRAGVLISFVSETVLVGFKSGVALYLASTQLPKLFGFSGSHGDFWERGHHFIAHLGETQGVALALGLAALTVLALGKRFLPNRPVALIVVVGGIAIAELADLSARGVRMLGDVPQGLPQFGLPAISAKDINELLPLAMACFLLAAVETSAIGRMFGQKHRYRLDSNQEFLALAVANLASGLGRGYPVSGGMSQSLVNESGGARTPLSGLIAALVVLLVVLFLSDLLRNLPQPVLAAIVLFAVTGLFKLSALKRLWHFNRGEFLVAMAALVGVLGSGLLRGVLIGAVLSLVLLLRRSSTPHTAELGRVPGTNYFADVKRDPQNQREPGVLVFRVDGALLYFNAEYVGDRLNAALAGRQDDVRLAVFFMGTCPAIDLAGAELLEELRHTFEARGVAFRVAEARGNVRDALQKAGFGAGSEAIQANQTIPGVIEEWRARRSAGA